jgi:hypothetical protein
VICSERGKLRGGRQWSGMNGTDGDRKMRRMAHLSRSRTEGVGHRAIAEVTCPVSSLIGHWPITRLARTGSAPRINWRRRASGANCYADRRLAPMRTALPRNSSRTPCDTAKNCLTRQPPKMIIRLRFCHAVLCSPPAGCFRHEVAWLGRNSDSHMEEFNAIQSCSLFRTWNSTADRCA